MEIYYHSTPWSNIEDIAKSQALLAPVELEAQLIRLESLRPKEREAEILRGVLARYGYSRTKEYKELKGIEYLRAIKQRAKGNINDVYHRVANVSVTKRLEQARGHTGIKGVVFELALNPKTVNGIYVPKRIPLERVIGILIYNGIDVDRMRAIELFGDYTSEIKGAGNETPNMHYIR